VLPSTDKTARTEMTQALKSEFGDGFNTFKDKLSASFKALDPDLRSALRDARTPDGRSLITRPDVVRLIHSVGTRQDRPQPQDRRAAMQAELTEIDTAMHEDVSSLYRPFRNTGLSASDRKAQILAEMDNPTPKPSAAALRAEEAELLKLHQTDPSVFEWSPTWRGTGKTAAQRLYELRSGRG
jgi:hypothetical protein